MTKEYNFGWIFWITAILILILALDVVWWAAILVTLLANVEFKITTTTHRRF